MLAALPTEITAAIIGAVAGISGAAVGSLLTARQNRSTEERRIDHERRLHEEQRERQCEQERAVARAAARVLRDDFRNANVALQTYLALRADGIPTTLEASQFATSLTPEDRRTIAGLLGDLSWLTVSMGERRIREANAYAHRGAGHLSPDEIELWILDLEAAGSALSEVARDESTVTFDRALLTGEPFYLGPTKTSVKEAREPGASSE